MTNWAGRCSNAAAPRKRQHQGNRTAGARPAGRPLARGCDPHHWPLSAAQAGAGADRPHAADAAAAAGKLHGAPRGAAAPGRDRLRHHGVAAARSRPRPAAPL
ncbi:hypothetical protein G6F68_018800 [Rhizopus microsporus]|nr:hypothetical protein G6F68_018800 [Rhizopus microsporus]